MAHKSKGKVLSIVINNEFIKICELTDSGKSIIIHKLLVISTPEGTYADGVIRDKNMLAKAIVESLNQNRITTSNIIFSIASTKIATKEVMIPNVKENKIDTIVETNAAEYFPVNVEEYILQHSFLERIEQDGIEKIKLLVMAIPTDIIERYYALADAMGMKILYIDYVGNSTHQAIKRQIGTENTLFIQIENDGTIVNIFENNMLKLQRTIPYGKSVAVNAVMEEYGVKYDVALKKLENENLLHTEFDGDLTTESIRYLVNNVNRIVDYYVSRNNNKMIEKACVIGNATRIKGFMELLSNELKLKLNVVNELEHVSIDRKSNLDSADISSFISNIGALINPVNFVPKGKENDARNKEQNKALVTILIAAVAGAAALILVPLIQLIAVKANIGTVKQNVDKIKDVESIVNEYYEAKDMNTDALTFQSLTKNNDDSIQNFITLLEGALPTDVSFSSMSITSGAVTVSGTAQSKASVAKMIQQLQTVKSVTDVKVASESESKDNTGAITVSFSLTCSFADVDVSN